MFHMFHDFVVILNLSYYYHVALFQGMRNSCCIHMLHYYHSQAIKYETNIIENVAYTCFSTMAWWDRWCTCLWNEMQFCGSQTPRVLQKGRKDAKSLVAACLCAWCVEPSSLWVRLCVSCPSKVGPSSGEPCPPFYRPRGEQGLQMGERGKYQEYRRSFEGFGSPFFPVPTLHNMADRVRGGVFVDLRRPCPGLI